MMKRASLQPKVGYFIFSRSPGDSVKFEEVFVYGPTYRSNEGAVGHDLRMRPTRLGPGDYTFVGSPNDVEWSRPGQAKKFHAQIKREVDAILAQKPGRKNTKKPSKPTVDCPCIEAGECNCHLMQITERCECPTCSSSPEGITVHHATVAKWRS